MARNKSGNLAFIVVYAENLMSKLRQANGRDKANVTGSYNGQSQACLR